MNCHHCNSKWEFNTEVDIYKCPFCQRTILNKKRASELTDPKELIKYLVEIGGKELYTTKKDDFSNLIWDLMTADKVTKKLLKKAIKEDDLTVKIIKCIEVEDNSVGIKISKLKTQFAKENGYPIELASNIIDSFMYGLGYTSERDMLSTEVENITTKSTSNIVNLLASEERALFDAFTEFTNYITHMASQGGLGKLNYQFNENLIYPRFSPERCNVISVDLDACWEIMRTMQGVKLKNITRDSSDEDILSYAEELTDSNLQYILISYVETRMELEGCERSYNLRKAKLERKEIEEEIEEEIKKTQVKTAKALKEAEGEIEELKKEIEDEKRKLYSKSDDPFDSLVSNFISGQLINTKEELIKIKVSEMRELEAAQTSFIVNFLASEERLLFDAFTTFIDAVTDMASRGGFEKPNYKFNEKLIYPRFSPDKCHVICEDLVLCWEIMLTYNKYNLEGLSTMASDEEILNFAEKLTDNNLQTALISYVKILKELESCELAYNLRIEQGLKE